jgi:hypothetical protein
MMEQRSFRQSAVIAYYAIFSIPGLCFDHFRFQVISLEMSVNQNILDQVSSTLG